MELRFGLSMEVISHNSVIVVISLSDCNRGNLTTTAKLCTKWRNGMVVSAVLLVIGRVQNETFCHCCRRGPEINKRDGKI
jgi:hypothetical protein